MDRQPSRQACERCHGLKLRCDRSATAKRCRRCLSARATCVFKPTFRGRQLVDSNPTPSTRPPRRTSIPHNSTEDVSDSDPLVRDPEVNPDTRTKETPASSLSLPFQHASSDLGSIPSSLNSTPLPPTSLAHFALTDRYSVGETLGNSDSAGMDFLMNLPSPQFADSTGMVTQPIAQPDFRMQFMNDLLALDVELIQHSFTLFNSTGNGLLPHIADRTLMIAQQMLKNFHSAECWVSQANYPQTWCPFLYQPPIPSEWKQAETSLDQVSTIHALSTYLRLVEAYEMLFTRATSNYTAAVQYGSWDSVHPMYTQAFPADGPAMQPLLSTQSTVPLLDRLSYMVQLLTLPFMEADVVRAMMATVREHESLMMQNVARLQQIEYDRL